MIAAGYKYLFVMTVSLLIAAETMADDSVVVKMRSDDIFFKGGITKESVASFIALYESQQHKPTLVTIQSKGGDVEAGMNFGEFVFSHGLSVRVLNYCLSSCANYIFPAGKVKYLTKHALVGWHGSVTSQQFSVGTKYIEVDCAPNEDCTSELVKQFFDASLDCNAFTNCDEARPKLEATFKATIEALISKQHAFFKMIGVDERVTVYGQEIHCNCIWTFSVDDMRRFNIRNIKDNQHFHFMESPFKDYLDANIFGKKLKVLQLPAE